MKQSTRIEKIVLLGFKGSGKTIVGKLLAKATGFEFLDVDTIIENLHGQAEQRKYTVRKIYEEFGREHFTRMEGKALQKASRSMETVISFGGGSPLNAKFDKDKFRRTAFIHLEVPSDALFGRIKKLGFPPFFDKENPRKSFDDLFLARSPVYRQIADFTVENSNKTPAQTCREILALLNDRLKVVKS